jgi:hypothetical protein
MTANSSLSFLPLTPHLHIKASTLKRVCAATLPRRATLLSPVTCKPGGHTQKYNMSKITWRLAQVAERFWTPGECQGTLEDHP